MVSPPWRCWGKGGQVLPKPRNTHGSSSVRTAPVGNTTGRLFPDNAALIAGCRNGDAQAWSAIVDRYERLVYAIPIGEGLSPDQAADVAQETFASLMAHVDKIRRPESLASWLMTVARRLSWKERHHIRRDVVDVSTIDLGSDVDLSAESVTVQWVYDAIQGLAEPCRSLVLSLFFDPAEPSYAEIALRLGRPLGSIGPLRARCLERLRTLLEVPE